MLALLIGSMMLGFAHSDGHQDCSCCKTACHCSVKACSCNYQKAPVLLPERNILSKLSFAGYFSQILNFSYHYMDVSDIFHPPKA